MKPGNLNAKYETRNPKHHTPIIFALPLLLSFSGCLFMRPYTPSARLQPQNQISMAYSAGVNNYSNNGGSYDYDYNSYTYSKKITVYSGSLLYTDIGCRTRIPNSDFELGVNLSNFSGLSLDAKYAFTKPGQDVPLLALDVSVFITGLNGFSAGYSAGPVLNIAFAGEKICDLVLASYYQNYNYRQFGALSVSEDSNPYYAYSSYAIKPPQSSLYLYAGMEFALDNGNVVAPGISYTYYLGANDQPQLFSAGLTIKTNAAPVKEQKTAAVNAAAALIESGNYISAAKEVIQAGDLYKASGILARGLEDYPGDYEMSLMQGFCMVKLGKKDLALKYYRDALALDRENPDLQETVINLRNEIEGK